MSDLHLEFYQGKYPPPPKKCGDVLVLAGDIHIGADAIPWIETCANVFDNVIYIAGNHEFYGKTMHKVIQEIPSSLAGYSVGKDYKLTKLFDPISNVHFLNNDSITIDNIKFIGSTLWSKASPFCKFNINDFNKITYKYPDGYGKFSTEMATELFYKNKFWIKTEIDPQLINVIVTHHAPSYSSTHPIFLTNKHKENNTAFATDILNEFENYTIAAWIHGHMHNTSEYVEYGVPVYCNPYGYENNAINPDFSWEKTIEV